MTLTEDEREIGSIAPASAWSRRAVASLPDDLALPVQVFLIWLAVLLWKRESDAGVSAAAT